MPGWKDKLYFSSPVWLQNLAVSTLGLQLRRRRFGSVGRDFEEYLSHTKNLPAEDLRQLQEREFSDLVLFCLKHVPFYRRLAEQDPTLLSDPPTLATINRLPIVEKEMLRKSPEMYRAEAGSYPGSTFFLGTSGTSGTPLELACDTHARQKHYAFWTRLRKANGIPPFAPRATFFGRIIMSPNDSSPPFWRMDRAQNNLLFSSYHLADRNLPSYYQALCKFAPTEIVGYPSSLVQIARYIVREGLPFPSPKAVFTTAETLLAPQRQMLETAFGAPIVDQYGCTEMVIFVAQCAQGGYHIHPEHGFLEILDNEDQPVSPGEAGSAVCTGFLNRAMPLIRYRIGDRLVACAGSCPCHSSFPLLASIEGRMDDILRAVDGRPLTRLDPVFKTLGGIAETQIIQTEEDLLVIKLVADSRFDETSENALVRELRKRTGADMRIRILRVPEIPKNKNGKFRAVISEIS